MPRTLELPEPLSTEIEQEAEREGVSSADHATFLLYVVTALHDIGKTTTPFQEALRGFLFSRSIDAENVSAALDELVQFYLTAPTGMGKTEAVLEIATAQETGHGVYVSLPYRTLALWRNATVHSPVDASFETVISPRSPSGSLTQATGRLNRSLEGTWEEMQLYSAELAGRRVRVEVLNGATEPEAREPYTSPEEWIKAFKAWTESHDPNTPLLSDEAISRESIYEDRG